MTTYQRPVHRPIHRPGRVGAIVLMVAILAIGFEATTSGSPMAAPPIRAERALENEPPTASQPVEEAVRRSLTPAMTVRGASSSQRHRLDEAIQRFSDAGLALPDMTVTFAGAESCDGHYGLYHHSESAPEVTICTELDFVYEHELAHAWVAFWVSDERRSRFMEIRATSSWNDPSADWGDRGIEQAAFVIQQTLALPLPTIQGREFENRVAAFEALTGMGDPRLAETPSLDPA